MLISHAEGKCCLINNMGENSASLERSAKNLSVGFAQQRAMPALSHYVQNLAAFLSLYDSLGSQNQ